MPCKTLGTWKAAEAGGFLWDFAASGAVLATNVFFNIAVLRLATVAAGCRPPGAGDDDDPKGCHDTIYGLKPSSFLTVIITVGQLFASCAMPFVGAAVDYTSWRRTMGAASAWLLCGTTLVQAMISRETWAWVAILQTVSIASYFCHSVATLSYLPGLSLVKQEGSDELVDDEEERFKVNAASSVWAMSGQVITLLLIATLSVAAGLGPINTAALAQLLAGLFCAGVYGSIWTGSRGTSCAFGEYPATKSLPAGATLFMTTIREVKDSWRTLKRRRPAARWFLVGYAFASAGFGSFGTLAVVFMHDHMRADAATTVFTIVLVIVFAVPASAASPRCMKKFGARKTFIASVIYMIGITLAATFALCGPKCTAITYVFCPLWGFGFGVFYSANNAYWTELVPRDAISQFMSLYYFAAQILGWAPPAAYTVLNQFLKETHLSLLITCLWLAISLPLFHKAGDSSAVHMKEESSDGLMFPPRITLADVGLADKKEGGNGGL